MFSEYRILRAELRLGLATAIVSPLGAGDGVGPETGPAGADAGLMLAVGSRTVSFNFGFLFGGSSDGEGRPGGGPIAFVPAGST